MQMKGIVVKTRITETAFRRPFIIRFQIQFKVCVHSSHPLDTTMELHMGTNIILAILC